MSVKNIITNTASRLCGWVKNLFGKSGASQNETEVVAKDTESRIDTEAKSFVDAEKQHVESEVEERAQQVVHSAEADVEEVAKDELTKIKGIGPVIEKKLHNLGVTTFRQIAELDSDGADRVNKMLNFKGRIQRENWIEQAKKLMS